ncbi:hypothetical protein [Thiofaba sp. EF100]|uniref:hypothetical protein n=1 Tax=Thiofaba sp. EF100 TaxID=3121274 RepID=UPI003221E912
MRPRKPPYAHQACARLAPTAQGRVPGFGTLIVHTGPRAWEVARHDPRACVLLPPGEAPEGFDWNLARLATPPVLIMDGGEAHALLDRLARAILRDAKGRALLLGTGVRPCPLYVAEEVAHAA